MDAGQTQPAANPAVLLLGVLERRVELTAHTTQVMDAYVPVTTRGGLRLPTEVVRWKEAVHTHRQNLSLEVWGGRERSTRGCAECASNEHKVMCELGDAASCSHWQVLVELGPCLPTGASHGVQVLQDYFFAAV